MNAPTTKVRNLIENYNGATVNYNSNYIAVASELADYVGDTWYEYVITLHNDLMPAFETRYFETLQDLANGMRELADLRKWSKPEEY